MLVRGDRMAGPDRDAHQREILGDDRSRSGTQPCRDLAGRRPMRCRRRARAVIMVATAQSLFLFAGLLKRSGPTALTAALRDGDGA